MIGSWYLLVGGSLASGLPLNLSILSMLIGNLLLCSIFYAYGGIGKETRKPSYEIANYVWGERGSRFLLSVLLAIGQLGWFVIGCEIAGGAISHLLSIPKFLGIAIFSITIALIVAKGIRFLSYVGWISVIGTVLLSIYSMRIVFFHYEFLGIWNYQPENGFSIIDGIDLVIASLISFTVITPDFLRLAKGRKDVALSSFLGVIPAALFAGIIGAVLTITTGSWDLSQVLIDLNLPRIAQAFLIVSTLWAASGLYPVTIAFSVVTGKFTRKRRERLSYLLGMIAILVAAIGIVSRFIDWLKFLGTLYPPIIGIVLADYYWVKKRKYEVINPISFSAIACWLLSCILAKLIPIGMTSLNSLIIAFFLYSTTMQVKKNCDPQAIRTSKIFLCPIHEHHQ
jgi:cytosine permease